MTSEFEGSWYESGRVSAESPPAIAAARIAQEATTCAPCFKGHGCGLSAIWRVIHFDRSVIARDTRLSVSGSCWSTKVRCPRAM
jgi:hypothetical protein